MLFRLLILLSALGLAMPMAATAQWLTWPAKTSAAPATQPAHAPPDAAVRLRLAGQGDQQALWIDNDLSGPVEVRISANQPLPGFPLHQAIPGRGAYRLGLLPLHASVHLTLSAVPGHAGSTPTAARYLYPLLQDRISIGQPPAGDFSHGDAENRHAIDFTAPIGTPVVAARGGILMQAEGRFPDTPGHLDEANFVRILHDDGSMAVYAHLQRGSIEGVPGQPIVAGQVIARSGNSGYSNGPHLHFVVQVNRGMRLESVPVQIETAAGELHLPKTSAQP